MNTVFAISNCLIAHHMTCKTDVIGVVSLLLLFGVGCLLYDSLPVQDDQLLYTVLNSTSKETVHEPSHDFF